MIALQTRSMIRADNLPMTCLMSCIFLQVFNKGVQVPITHNPSWKTKKTIKNSLFTVLQENPLKWPSIIEEVVFANRVSKHSFTKEFPFQVTTQSRTSITSRCKNISFHLRNIRFLTSLLKRASLAICYPGSRNKYSKSKDIYIDDEVLLRKNKHEDKKDGKFSFKWLWLYFVSDITKS